MLMQDWHMYVRHIIFLKFSLTALSTCNEDQSDMSDLELIQHINVDIVRLIKLLNGKKHL